jgi:hypothetical protein
VCLESLLACGPPSAGDRNHAPLALSLRVHLDGREKGGQIWTSTVRDYSQGLAGLFWRNFYGPPFIRLFGERLATLAPEYRQPLGDDLVLVQPYVLPTEAGTDAGAARERELIAHLGPECFYDHTHHVPPTRGPVLDHLSEPLH